MDKIMSFIIGMRKNYFLAKIAYVILRFIGVIIPPTVKLGKNFKLVHWAYGSGIHPNTIVGDNVRIYSGVTIGRGDIFIKNRDDIQIIIEDDVIVCTGAKILCKDKKLVVGKGSIIGANAVLLNSTGPGEVWAGIPARKVKDICQV